MNRHLNDFLLQFARVVLMTLLPVVLTAFLAIPTSLGGHPGESVARSVVPDSHMS